MHDDTYCPQKHNTNDHLMIALTIYPFSKLVEEKEQFSKSSVSRFISKLCMSDCSDTLVGKFHLVLSSSSLSVESGIAGMDVLGKNTIMTKG
jgi:hypothetical protein